MNSVKFFNNLRKINLRSIGSDFRVAGSNLTALRYVK